VREEELEAQIKAAEDQVPNSLRFRRISHIRCNLCATSQLKLCFLRVLQSLDKFLGAHDLSSENVLA
jgi:hypothetical protein